MIWFSYYSVEFECGCWWWCHRYANFSRICYAVNIFIHVHIWQIFIHKYAHVGCLVPPYNVQFWLQYLARHSHRCIVLYRVCMLCAQGKLLCPRWQCNNCDVYVNRSVTSKSHRWLDKLISFHFAWNTRGSGVQWIFLYGKSFIDATLPHTHAHIPVVDKMQKRWNSEQKCKINTTSLSHCCSRIVSHRFGE